MEILFDLDCIIRNSYCNYSLVAHVLPVHPGLHLHVLCLMQSVQTPPLFLSLHGLGAHWLISETCKMSLFVRKPVFGVSDLVRQKPGCAAIEDG